MQTLNENVPIDDEDFSNVGSLMAPKNNSRFDSEMEKVEIEKIEDLLLTCTLCFCSSHFECIGVPLDLLESKDYFFKEKKNYVCFY